MKMKQMLHTWWIWYHSIFYIVFGVSVCVAVFLLNSFYRLNDYTSTLLSVYLFNKYFGCFVCVFVCKCLLRLNVKALSTAYDFVILYYLCIIYYVCLCLSLCVFKVGAFFHVWSLWKGVDISKWYMLALGGHGCLSTHFKRSTFILWWCFIHHIFHSPLHPCALAVITIYEYSHTRILNPKFCTFLPHRRSILNVQVQCHIYTKLDDIQFFLVLLRRQSFVFVILILQTYF